MDGPRRLNLERLARVLLALDPDPQPGERWHRQDGRGCTIIGYLDLGAGKPVMVEVQWDASPYTLGREASSLVSLHRFHSNTGTSGRNRLYRTELGS